MTGFIEDAEERLLMHENALNDMEGRIHVAEENLAEMRRRRDGLIEAVERDKIFVRNIKG